MPSGGYGPGETEDEDVIRTMIGELEPSEMGWIPTLMMTYVAARMQGAKPEDASWAAWLEWDL